MKRKDQMPSKPSPCHAYVTDHTDEPSSGNEDPENVFPNLLQFLDKGFVFIYVAKLVRVLVITLQVPVRGRGDYEMDRLIFQEGQIPGVSID
jgi:hypothetical protein